MARSRFLGYQAAPPEAKPSRPLISVSRASKSRPKKRISPASGWTKWSRALRVVVLPAPLRPIKPVIVPGAREKDTSRRAKPG